jgi:hypothetical protein
MTIWLFAEERSGSTWLITHIAGMLNLPFAYIEQDGTVPDGVHQTHSFDRLKDAHGVLLRSTRKDVFEHFLSWIIMDRAKTAHPEWYSHPFMQRGSARDRDLDRLTEVCADKFDVVRGDIQRFLVLKKARNIAWDAKNAVKQTIFYEDLIEGVSIPELGIDRIAFSDGGLYDKLPYDKWAVITNTDQALQWLKEEML